MATTRANQSPVVYGWGDCLNNKLSNGIVNGETAKTDKPGGGSLVDSMLSPMPPTWTRPKKISSLTASSLTKMADEEEGDEEESRGSGPTIIRGVACGAHNSAFLAVGGPWGDSGVVFMSGAGLSAHGTSLLCDVPASAEGNKNVDQSQYMLHSPLTMPVVLPRPGPLEAQTVTQVSLGNYHAALVTRTGQTYTWGWGSLGQLGHGDGKSKSEPTHVLSLYAVHQVDCGTKFTAAVTLFGELYVFGENEQGQLGLGNTQRQLSPVQCKRLASYTITTVSCGAAHITAVSTDSLDRSMAGSGGGMGYATGAQNVGAGLGGFGDSDIPGGGVDADGNDLPFMALASFNPSSATRPCAGVSTRVWTWGQSSTSGRIETLPREIVSLRGLGIQQVACGEMHSLALSSLGQVFEWKVGEVPAHVGGALQGQLVRSIDAGAYHSLALTASGKLFSWGRSKTGQLGRTDSGDMAKPGLVPFEKKPKVGKDEETRTKLARSVTTADTSTSPPRSSPAVSPTPKSPAAASGSSGKPAPVRSASSIVPGSGAVPNPFIARISAGEYHNIAIVERDPRRLLLWKILKKERQYLLKLHIVVDMYMAAMAGLSPDPSSSPISEGAPDWQRILGEWAVVGTPHAVSTSNSASFTLYKQYHSLAASATQSAASGDAISMQAGMRGSTSSPRHRSTSSSTLSNPASPVAHSTSSAALANTASPRGSVGAKSAPGNAQQQQQHASEEQYRQLVGDADFQQVLHSVFGNLASIYRMHSQFVQEIAKVVEDSHGFGSDAGAAVDAVLTLWRFRLSFFSMYAFYADQYSVGAFHLYVLAKSFPHINALLKAIQELALSRFARQGVAPPDFSLKHLLLEPLRHVALETQLLRQLQDTCLQPGKNRKSTSDAFSAALGGDGLTGKQRPSYKAPAPPPAGSVGPASPLTRKPSLSTRPAPPMEALPSALSHGQFAWHAPYLYNTSFSTNLDETLAHMSGLLERVAKNFNFVDATEILSATMDERGFPQISGGSVELLVKRLTHHSFTDNEFVNAFLLTYRMFITPIQFLTLLTQRYSNAYPPGLDEREKEAYNKLVRQPIQSRVVQVIHQWVQSPLASYDWQPKIFGGELDENQKALHAAINHWCKTVLDADPDNKELKANTLFITGLLNIYVGKTAKGEDRSKPSTSVAMPTPLFATAFNSPASPSALTVIADATSVLHFENNVKAIAQTIATQDFAVLKEISAKDFLNKSWTRDNFDALAPALHALTKRFNALGSWACYEVVNPENAKDRTAAITCLTNLATALLELRDYNAFVAIMSGLGNSSSSRLKKSFGKISSKTQQAFDQMAELAGGKENYRFLRQLWLVAQPPAVPFLALTLKDLTFIEDGNPDKLEDGSTNFYKYRKMAEVITLCLSTRDVVSMAKSDPIFDAYLKKVLPAVHELGEDGLYKLSKKRE